MSEMNDDSVRRQRWHDPPKRKGKVRNRETRVRMAHQRAEDQLQIDGGCRCSAQILERDALRVRLDERKSALPTRGTKNGECDDRTKKRLSQTRVQRGNPGRQQKNNG